MFGRLTAVRLVDSGGRQGRWWLCKCECGEVEPVNQFRLRVSDNHEKSIKSCSKCRKKICIVCNSGFTPNGSAKTCSAQCKTESRKRHKRKPGSRPNTKREPPREGESYSTAYRRQRGEVYKKKERECQREYWSQKGQKKARKRRNENELLKTIKGLEILNKKRKKLDHE